MGFETCEFLQTKFYSCSSVLQTRLTDK